MIEYNTNNAVLNSLKFVLGYGVYYYHDGRRYAGEYRDDRRHGVGVETDVDGTVLCRGRWVMGDFDPTTIIS